ncbi:MAG: VWA domain-containing protein [Cyanobacteriota bacterium]
MFRFEDPIFLLFLLFIPLMIYHYLNKKGGLKIKYSSLNVISDIGKKDFAWSQHILLALRLFAVILIVLSLARPQIHEKVKEIISSGIDIMLVLDTSGSMEAKDFSVGNRRINRLEAVKEVVSEFVTKRPGDRIGMIVFGTNAYTQCPATLDHGILATFLKDINIGIAGTNTAIGSAIGIAVKRLKDIDAKSKIIILLTDGRNHTGQIAPLTAAELAKTYGIKIYTIGVGSNNPSMNYGPGSLFYNFGVPQEALDEETLKEIADITGGLYFKATDTTGLKKIYETIDKLEKTKIKVKEYGHNTELYINFLTAGLLLLLTELILANTIFSKIP